MINIANDIKHTKLMLTNPERLSIVLSNDKKYVGGSQKWFKRYWQRKSGCGPIAASNLIWYMMQKRKNQINDSEIKNVQSEYIDLIHEMFQCFKPGIKGINTSALFVQGILRFAQMKEYTIHPYILDVPRNKHDRPTADIVFDFISSGIREDSPVAFLNLSRGLLRELHNWHWMTILAIKPEMMIEISDYGKLNEVNISEWLDSSKLGGAFVYIVPR